MSIVRVVALCALLAVHLCAHALEVPLLSGRVVDNAEMLSPAARAEITAKLKAHEESTGNQIALLTIPTLESDSVEAYAVRVFETWKLGKKGADNGVLVIAVPKERKLRIEVGYGLEGTLTDAVTSRIIRNVIAPQFKANHFDEGMRAGVDALIGQLEGKGADALPAPLASTPQSSKTKTTSLSHLSVTERILWGLFIFGIIGLFTVIGVIIPGMGWFLYVFLIPFWAIFPTIVIGFTASMTLLAAYLIGFPIAKILLARTDWHKKFAGSGSTRRGRRRSRFDGVNHSGGSWSSDSSSSSSSSDSFSGGGGESGGGGSSGDW